MVDRVRHAILDDPWRSSALLLALSLVTSLGLVFLDEDDSDETPVGAATTTTTNLTATST